MIESGPVYTDQISTILHLLQSILNKFSRPYRVFNPIPLTDPKTGFYQIEFL
jgi:hypothetical protein